MGVIVSSHEVSSFVNITEKRFSKAENAPWKKGAINACSDFVISFSFRGINLFISVGVWVSQITPLSRTDSILPVEMSGASSDFISLVCTNVARTMLSFGSRTSISDKSRFWAKIPAVAKSEITKNLRIRII